MENSVTDIHRLSPFGICCHDAGGAAQVAAMIRATGQKPEWAILEGPAVSVFQRICDQVPPLTQTHSMTGVRSLITGTGWASNLEHSARMEARTQGIYCVAVLDHWVNYGNRFQRDGKTVLPDEIWVVDRFAEELAKVTFPNIKVALKPDSHAEFELSRILPIQVSTPNTLLYLLEPVRSNWGREKPGEFQALEYFFERITTLALPENIQVALRLHPSEPQGKYDAICQHFGVTQIESCERTLSESISASRWVAGVQTYAMTLALKSGRRVFSSLPPWAPSKVLPHVGIEYLREANEE